MFTYLLNKSQVLWFGNDFGTIIAGTSGSGSCNIRVKTWTHTCDVSYG